MSTSEFQTAKQMEQVYQLLLRCGAKCTSTDFCVQLVKDISGLLLYDQARVLFLDKTGKKSAIVGFLESANSNGKILCIFMRMICFLSSILCGSRCICLRMKKYRS